MANVRALRKSDIFETINLMIRCCRCGRLVKAAIMLDEGEVKKVKCKCGGDMMLVYRSEWLEIRR